MRTTDLRSKGTIFENARLSIVVPVFNEGSNILQNLNLLVSEVEAFFPNYEIIAVSDGSTDETGSKLLSFRHPGMTPIIFERNVGKGNAVRSGLARATGDFVLFIDGGMEIHPREIRIFMGLMSLYESDIVIGSKRHPQSQVIYPWYRRVLSRIFQMIVRQLFRVDVTDTQVGIKLFRAEVVHAILPHLEINRYGFDLELLSLARIAGYKRVLEAPIRLDYFHKKERPVVTDLWHVVKVGISLAKDTYLLYKRLRNLKIERPAQAVEAESEKLTG